jgi:hypothetical protein
MAKWHLRAKDTERTTLVIVEGSAVNKTVFIQVPNPDGATLSPGQSDQLRNMLGLGAGIARGEVTDE